RAGQDLWEKLEAYVQKGGAVAVLPGSDTDRTDYAENAAARRLLPGELVKYEANARGVGLTSYQFQHPLLTRFRDWLANPEYALAHNHPLAFAYWVVKPEEKTNVLVRYDDADQHPALLERVSEVAGGR